MKRTLTLLALVAALLASCGPRHHLRKMEYHKRMALAKGAVIKTDTVVQVVEFTIPEVAIDTVFKAGMNTHDTLTVYKDRAVLRVIRLPGDSIRVACNCLPDTVIKHVRVGYPIEINAGPTTSRIVGLCLSLLVVGLIVGYFVRRK